MIGMGLDDTFLFGDFQLDHEVEDHVWMAPQRGLIRAARGLSIRGQFVWEFAHAAVAEFELAMR